MGLFDSFFGSEDTSAQDYLKQALAQYQNVNIPTIESEQVNGLPMESVTGQVNPNQINVAEQAPTEFNNISLDPSTRQAQINALTGYQDIANAGGLDAKAKLALQEATDAANTQSRGDQGAIMKSAEAEGQGGGDFALTQRAIASQGATNNAANAGMSAAAEAEANREAALNNMATIGGNVNASDYNQAAAKAGSQNTINATNTAAKNAANTGNVANNLTAQTENLQNAQNVNAANTTAKQGNVYYNASLPQQQFNNEMAKANGAAGVNTNAANTSMQANMNQANQAGQLLKGGALLGATALGGPVGGAAAKLATGYDGMAVVPEHCYAEGGEVHNHYMCMLMGGKVPGEATVPGNSLKNDTQPALLSPGELVIPRDVPKDGKHMEEFAKNAPVGGNPKKKIDMTSLTKGYKRSK